MKSRTPSNSPFRTEQPLTMIWRVWVWGRRYRLRSWRHASEGLTSELTSLSNEKVWSGTPSITTSSSFAPSTAMPLLESFRLFLWQGRFVTEGQIIWLWGKTWSKSVRLEVQSVHFSHVSGTLKVSFSCDTEFDAPLQFFLQFCFYCSRWKLVGDAVGLVAK